MNWIDVKDKLPETDRDVIISDGEGYYTIAWYNKLTELWDLSVDLIRGVYCYHVYLDADVKFWAEITPCN